VITDRGDAMLALPPLHWLGLLICAAHRQNQVGGWGVSIMSMYHHTRRDVLCGGGASVFAAIMTSLLGGTKPLRAQAIAGAVPEVNRLSVRIVIDSYQFAVVPGKRVGPADPSTSAGV
jgi:hypothetical protein